MSTPSALNLAAAPLVSGLPDARPASAMGGIAPGALPELAALSAPAPLELFVNPEGARKAPPDERPKPETAKKSEPAETRWVFFDEPETAINSETAETAETAAETAKRLRKARNLVAIRVWTAPKDTEPTGKFEAAFYTELNVRKYIDDECKNEKLTHALGEICEGGNQDNKEISFDSWRNPETKKFLFMLLEDAKYFDKEDYIEEEYPETDDCGRAMQEHFSYPVDATHVINLIAKDWECESQDPVKKWVQKMVFNADESESEMSLAAEDRELSHGGTEVDVFTTDDETEYIQQLVRAAEHLETMQGEIFTTFGIKGVLEEHVGSRRKMPDWKQVRMQPAAEAAQNRYPTRAGRSKRDFGKMVPLRSADCSDASEKEEEEEPLENEMIDDVDTPEELAAAARKARKAAKRARKAAKKAAKNVVDLTGDSE